MLMLILGVVLGMCIYSFARARISLTAIPEAMNGEASAYMPLEPGKVTAKGSSELKFTGPVWVEQ